MSIKIDRLPEDVSFSVTLRIHANGALSIEGPVHDKEWMLALLDNAKDAVVNHHRPRTEQAIVIPQHDVSIQAIRETLN